MKTKKKRRHTGFKIFLLLVLLVSFLFYDSNTRIVVNEYPVYYKNLPASFDGYRIVQLSDIHAAVFGDGNSTLINAVKKANADIIVITGDLINSSDDSSSDIGIVGPLIQSLVEIAPVYYVTGNHEWATDWLQKLLKMLEDDGVTVLRNDDVALHSGKDAIILAGLDDPNGPKDMKKPETLLSEIREKEGDPFIVLLEHRNNYLEKFSKLDIDLVLCGHAHGGLIRLPFVGGLIGPSLDLFPKYTNGMYSAGKTNMIVSRGIGNNTGVPRFLNNPEIVVAILRKS